MFSKNIIQLHCVWFLLCVCFLQSCIKEKNTLIEMPQIQIVSPLPCDTIYYDKEFRFRAIITDNIGLGFISMDIHNNFGHHSHGNHETCNIDVTKSPQIPYINNWIFELPRTKTEYILDTILMIKNNTIDDTKFDVGDYHFHVYVTDNEGYQIFTSFDCKLLDKYE